MHCLTDFKNFARAELNLFEPLTVLLGRNGSGKTNLIEGVELLATLARGVPLNEISDVDRGGIFEVRGGLRSCIRFGRKSSDCDSMKPSFVSMARASPSTTSSKLLRAEEMTFSCPRRNCRSEITSSSMQRIPAGELMEVRYDNFSRGRNPNCQVSASAPSSHVTKKLSETVRRTGLRLRASTGTVQFVRGYLRNSYIFDPQPKAMREYARAESNPQLLRGGANLSAVLFALSEGDEERQAALQRITEVVRQIPEEPFIKIGFADTSLATLWPGSLPTKGRRRAAGS